MGLDRRDVNQISDYIRENHKRYECYLYTTYLTSCDNFGYRYKDVILCFKD